ncbi:hypothetical protein [Rummeliibacillus sp. TYF-LIM-RU47]|uniref:hypothetical protein n=1 Tax=Rummeliibacillus sp. TYF-LIM-RU47 TaxID=2608406 RepID=UPI0012392E19|nr:hypothetical protein [Rummeliibacillus sp. TYF-LIM-RU47]
MANNEKKNLSTKKEAREESGLSFDLNPDDFEETKHDNAAKAKSDTYNVGKQTEADTSKNND